MIDVPSGKMSAQNSLSLFSTQGESVLAGAGNNTLSEFSDIVSDETLARLPSSTQITGRSLSVTNISAIIGDSTMAGLDSQTGEPVREKAPGSKKAKECHVCNETSSKFTILCTECKRNVHYHCDKLPIHCASHYEAHPKAGYTCTHCANISPELSQYYVSKQEKPPDKDGENSNVIGEIESDYKIFKG